MLGLQVILLECFPADPAKLVSTVEACYVIATQFFRDCRSALGTIFRVFIQPLSGTFVFQVGTDSIGSVVFPSYLALAEREVTQGLQKLPAEGLFASKTLDLLNRVASILEKKTIVAPLKRTRKEGGITRKDVTQHHRDPSSLNLIVQHRLQNTFCDGFPE